MINSLSCTSSEVQNKTDPDNFTNSREFLCMEVRHEKLRIVPVADLNLMRKVAKVFTRDAVPGESASTMPEIQPPVWSTSSCGII
jgi:hypothetical protein